MLSRVRNVEASVTDERTSMEHWWIDTDRGKLKDIGWKSVPLAFYLPHIPQNKPGIEPRSSRWKARAALTSICCAYTQMTPRKSAVRGAAIRPALRKASPIANSAEPMFPFNRCISVSRNLRVGPRSKDIHYYNLTEMWARICLQLDMTKIISQVQQNKTGVVHPNMSNQKASSKEN
jgi:hypothetical protein